MTRIKSTLVLSSLCANYRRLQDPLSIRHIQKKPNQGHGRTPTWRKVTTERISLSADQTQALLHVKITVLDLFYPAGCWPGLTPPPMHLQWAEQTKAKPSSSPVELRPCPRGGDGHLEGKGVFMLLFSVISLPGSIRRTQGHLGAELPGPPAAAGDGSGEQHQ